MAAPAIAKPAASTALNVYQPLYTGLVASFPMYEGTGHPKDIVTDTAGTASGAGTPTWASVTETGTAFILGTGGSGYKYEDFATGASALGTTWTIAFMGTVTAGSYVGMLTRGDSPASASPAAGSFGLGSFSSGSPFDDLAVYYGGTRTRLFTSPSTDHQARHLWVLVRDGDDFTLYADGTSVGTGAVSSAAASDSTADFKIGEGSSQGAPLTVECVHLWNTALDATARAALLADPWIMYRALALPELSCSTDNNADFGPGVTVDEPMSQYSAGSAGDPATEGIRTVTIENVFAADITIDSVGVTGDATLLSDPSSTVLAFGETVQFQIQFDTTRVAGTYTAPISIDYSGTGVGLNPFDFTVSSVLTDPGGGTYYVDFENGDDAESGRTTAKAFKYHPWDANATGASNGVTIGADTIISFAPGVHYPTIVAAASGSSGQLIRHLREDSASWGAGEAVFDGSTSLSSWTVCTSAADALGCSDYTNCYKATLPAGVKDIAAHLYSDLTLLDISRSPSVGADNYKIDDLANMRTLAQTEIAKCSTLDYDAGNGTEPTIGETITGGTSGATGVVEFLTGDGTTGTIWLSGISGTFQDNETITGASSSADADGTITATNDIAITDATGFSGWDSAWHQDGAPYAMVWMQPNIVFYLPVADYDSTNSIVLLTNSADEDPYTDRSFYYCIVNTGHAIDNDGEYATEVSANKVVLKNTGSAPADDLITCSVPRIGFNRSGQSYLSIEGGTDRKFTGGLGDFSTGFAIFSASGSGGSDFSVLDTELHDCFHAERSASYHLADVDNLTVGPLDVHDSIRCRGVYAASLTGCEFTDVTVDHVSGTGIFWQAVTNGNMTRPQVTNHFGPHANGITLYTACTNCVVDEPTVYGGSIALTTQDGVGITVQKGLLHTDYVTYPGYTVADWGGTSGLKFYNCVILGATDAHFVSATSLTGLEKINCVSDGYNAWASGTHTNNLYRKLSASGTPQSGVSWDSHVASNAILLETDLDNVFVDVDNYNVTQLADSVTIDAGTDVGLTFVGSAPDISSIEYSAGNDSIQNLGLGLGI